ncbi:putative HAUS augmin-like complex subunit 1 [Helianthus annuus]|nr:putative HAUS augmin-like complex subunit 1 [Helianthus annuus]KAJ0915345.1 putative HAUS augmin-like complex subunit 1 [Helianthus annuus]
MTHFIYPDELSNECVVSHSTSTDYLLHIHIYFCIYTHTNKRLIKNSFQQAMLNRVGYTPEISHGMLVEMAEHRKDLEKKTKPILDTLRSYQDLPPDKALAALAIEDKKRQYNAAEKYLEDVLQSALATSED